MQRIITEQYLPTGSFRPERIGLTPDNQIVEKFHQVSAALSALRLQHRLHYFFGQYQGEANSGKDNQKRAVYLREEGVEPWRPIKSIAYTTPKDELVITHLRQDRRVDIASLARELGVKPEDLALANLEIFNLQYGTISPFISQVQKVSSSGSVTIVEPRHIFDADLIGGPDHPRDDFILTSSGDPRMYVELDVSSYIKAYYRVDNPALPYISQPSSEKKRVYPRFPVNRIIGGDNAKDPDEFALRLKDRARERQIEIGEYYGDRSDLPVISDSMPLMARTIDTGEYGLLLQQQIAKKAQQHATSNEMWVMSSTAGDGVLGDTLRKIPGINYRGRKEPTERFIKDLAKQDIRLAQIVLLGLSSIYNPSTSAFAGRILDRSVPVSSETQKTMEALIKDAKTGAPDVARYFQLVEVILRKYLREKFNNLIWGEPEEGRETRKPVVVVINGATELAKIVEEWKQSRSKAPSLWAPIASTEPGFIAQKFAEPYFEKTLAQRRRLILFSPVDALIDRIVAENLGLSETFK